MALVIIIIIFDVLSNDKKSKKNMANDVQSRLTGNGVCVCALSVLLKILS